MYFVFKQKRFFLVYRNVCNKTVLKIWMKGSACVRKRPLEDQTHRVAQETVFPAKGEGARCNPAHLKEWRQKPGPCRPSDDIIGNIYPNTDP